MNDDEGTKIIGINLDRLLQEIEKTTPLSEYRIQENLSFMVDVGWQEYLHLRSMGDRLVVTRHW